MKKTATLVILVLGLNCFSQNQNELSQNASFEAKASDMKLNKIYQTILKEYARDTLFIKNLKKSQSIWVKFRKAELDMKYPNYPGSYYGSSFGTTYMSCYKRLTDKRSETLKKWLFGSTDEECGAGSINYLDTIMDEYEE